VNVLEFDPNRSDEMIAARAIAQLRADFAKGHILMARVDTIARADKVFALYERYPEFNPVKLHTQVPARAREDARQAVVSKRARHVVCVDMLGEGFDLPKLKIAAFHDIRKSLAVTLQLAGRFTRSRPDLGDATFIANTADVTVRNELRKLYTRDPDWNLLLPEFSDTIVRVTFAVASLAIAFSSASAFAVSAFALTVASVASNMWICDSNLSWTALRAALTATVA
jgi:superfamily II DNA/RNA helicase